MKLLAACFTTIFLLNLSISSSVAFAASASGPDSVQIAIDRAFAKKTKDSARDEVSKKSQTRDKRAASKSKKIPR